VNVDRVIDRKTARKLRQLAAQTGASVVMVLERSIEIFLAADEAEEKVIPEPIACTVMNYRKWR
jgi:predicted transcriptional regulator